MMPHLKNDVIIDSLPSLPSSVLDRSTDYLTLYPITGWIPHDHLLRDPRRSSRTRIAMSRMAIWVEMAQDPNWVDQDLNRTLHLGLGIQ